MRKNKKLFISRSSDYAGGGFGFTLRHFVIYPPSVSMNDILRASYSVVIDEHQQKQLETEGHAAMAEGGTAASGSLIYHQGEEQQRASPRKIFPNEHLHDDGTALTNPSPSSLQAIDTIFVKEVRLDGPAYLAGLRQGDRILTVNDQSIHGKTYSQVIAMIQNAPADLVLNVLPKDDADILPFNSSESRRYSPFSSSHHETRRLPPLISSSYRPPPSTTVMPNTTIEQKLRNLQINLAQGRTQEELAQAGIFFPPSTTSKSNETSIPPGQANAFSNYIDSVHRALDSSKPAASISSIPESKVDPPSYYSSSPYHHDYVHHDYQRVVAPSFQVNFSPPISTFPSRSTFVRLPPPDDDQWANRRDSFPSHEELKSPSTTDSVGVSSSTEKSPLTEADMKTEFVNFRKKQFETGHVENIVRDPQRESKTKKYSEKKKYENEWNRLTAVADVESVMDRASHFEDIDRDKFARLKSKLPTSPPIPEHLNPEDAFNYEFNPNPNHFYDHPIKLLKTSLDSARVGEMNHLQFNFDPRFLLEQIRSQPTQYLNSNDSARYPSESYSRGTALRQASYINAVRPGNEPQPDFVAEFGSPISAAEEEMKQRRTSYLLATDQRRNPREEYFASRQVPEQQKSENYSYDSSAKSRSSSQNQTQAIKKLKNFFGENSRQISEGMEHRPSFSQSPLSPHSSSGGQSKSGSFFDGSSNPRESISLSTMPEHFEPSKEGILYCKTVLKEGRRALDRSWRGAWAVLRRGALFLGKEKKHGLLIPLSCDSFPINLHNADVELASDYVKKPRVFKVTTANASEFLFQAPDLQSLNEWLDVISEHCQSSSTSNLDQQQEQKKELSARQSTSSLPPMVPTHEMSSEKRKSTSSSATGKSKISLRSPSLKRSPSLRFRKSQKASITQPAQIVPSSIADSNSPPNGSTSSSPRRSFVKSIVKKGLRTLKSSSSLLTSQMSGQVYDESSGESLSSVSGVSPLTSGMNFSIELEECESSSVSRCIPIVVEILTRLVELRGINYQGIYRHAGGLSAVNWLVNELDKGAERIDLNSEKWYDVKAVASTLKTFFAKLPDSLLSSKMSSMCVEASRIETHRDRLVELKRLLVQLDDYRFETLKYLCAHFRKVASKCDVNKIDARNLAIIFGPTLIWDSKASLQSNLVDNPEKIRIVESFILYHEWFFDDDEFNSIPMEINPQMPRLPPIENVNSELTVNNDTKPGEIIQHIVCAAKRRWSSAMLLDGLSSLTSNSNDQQTQAKPINISVKSVVRPN